MPVLRPILEAGAREMTRIFENHLETRGAWATGSTSRPALSCHLNFLLVWVVAEHRAFNTAIIVGIPCITDLQTVSSRIAIVAVTGIAPARTRFNAAYPGFWLPIPPQMGPSSALLGWSDLTLTDREQRAY